MKALMRLFTNLFSGVETVKFMLAAFMYTLGRQPWFVRMFKIVYRRSRKRIEIDLTYDCQLKCLNCNRSCTQAPSKEFMTIAQINKFVEESVQQKTVWERIRLIGGEPTLHPDLLAIIKILLEYKHTFSPKTDIQLITNGFGPKVKEVLEQIPRDITIFNSQKKSSVQFFCSFNVAPQDSAGYKTGDYMGGCINSSSCGIGLNSYGYYCCGVAGGIDRVMGFDIGKKRLPVADDEMDDQLRVFCKVCGIFASFRLITSVMMSPSWVKAYERYKTDKPHLTRY